MSDVDFYAILEVDTVADEDTIRAAIRRERRVWIRRQNAPDAKRRAEAELRVAHLDEAEQVLLDPASRRAYDAQRAKRRRQEQQADQRANQSEQREKRSEQSRPDDVGELLDRAAEYLRAGNPRLAHEVAKDAVRADPRNSEAWAYRGYASIDLDDYEQAESEFREALRLGPWDTDRAVRLAHVQLVLGWHDRADHTLLQIERSDPGDLDARMARAHYYVVTDQPDAAYGVLFGLIEVQPEDHALNELAARALRDMTLARLSMWREDYYVFTSKAQLTFAREHLARAAALEFDDAELRDDIARWLGIADDAARRVPGNGSPKGVGCLGLAALGFVIVANIAGGLLGGLLSMILVGFAGWGLWVVSGTPQWKLNRKQMETEGGYRWGI